MIIKKKIKSIKGFKLLNNIFSKIVMLSGIMTIFLFFISSVYYFNSGMKNDYPPKFLIKKIDELILNKYIGFSLFEIDDYFVIKFQSLKYLFLKNDLENFVISIDQKNLYKLESQRKKKLENKFYKFDNFADASIKFKEKKYNVKMRVKGDRSLHWEVKDRTSYKIDIKGEKRLLGLEEFSVQKPITRNYIYEFIFHKLLEFNNLISLKYHFVNFKMNDTHQGIYALEEGFSKELIERNKKRNGPIFGLNEDDGVLYPNVIYDLYSEKYWTENYPELVKNAFAKLNSIKKNQADLNEFFDLEKWAKFFAVIDFSNALHGSLSKSVKLYYNPATGKFEPIGFDGHYFDFEVNSANEFIILDFLNPNNKNCNQICFDRNWYLKFLKKKDGTINRKFIDLYIKELNKISSKEFLNGFKEKHLDKIEFYNSQFFSEKSNKDRIIFKGLGYFIFEKNYLDNRKNYIQQRLANINSDKFVKLTLEDNKIKFYSNRMELKRIVSMCPNEKTFLNFIFSDGNIDFDQNCEYFLNNKKLDLFQVSNLNFDLKKIIYFDLSKNNKLIFKNDTYYLNEDLIVEKNVLFPKNNKLIIKPGVQIIFKNKSILKSEGSIHFNGTIENPILINGNSLGSIILNKNNFKIHYTKTYNLSKPDIDDKILHGGINIIESNLEILNSDITDSKSEDAINIISSNTYIDNLKIFNTFSDAIDVDFGIINFKNIYCENVGNDCFDVSGGKVYGEYLEATNIKDKGISFGENSEGSIKSVNFKKNYLAIAVKDGSELIIDESNFLDNKFDVSVFKKKNEFGQAKLYMNKTNKSEDLNYLIGIDNNFLFEKELVKGITNNNYIYNLFY